MDKLLRTMAPDARLDRAALLRALPFIAGYGLCALAAIQMSPLPISAVWPSNAILACALLMLDRRAAIVCVVGSLAFYVAIVAAITGSPVRPLAYGLVNLPESLLLAYLLRRIFGRNLDFSDGRRLLIYLAAIVAPVSALAAVWVTVVAAVFNLSVAPNLGLLWLVSHAMGAAMAAPVISVFANRRRYRLGFGSVPELAAATAVLLMVSAAILWGMLPTSLMFLIFPMMMLVAFRYGPIGAVTGSLAFSAAAVVFMSQGLPNFMGGLQTTVLSKLLWLQFFVAVVSLTALPVAGAVASYVRMRGLLARRTTIARSARGRADAAAAAKGEFLANMSHEIRTPLNGVIGLADALSRTELAPEQRVMLDMVLDSGKALTGLLSDALDLARADSGALELVNEPFDVRDAIGSSAYLFETIARKKGLAFEVSFDVPEPGLAVGDALRIKQVVSNLISNAVKFTTDGSVSVEVSLQPLPSGLMRLQAVVRDTGPGFGEEVKARLFKRFEQGDSSVTRRYGGSGLGLSIAHRLTQMMQGSIHCESAPGLGSMFAFTVNLRGADAIVEAPRAAAPQAPEKRLSVLLAEDHPVNRLVVQAMLGEAAELTIAVNGEEAVEAFRTRPFDLILMDTHMPVMDGLTAIRTIRDEERRTGRLRTPIVSLTADAMPRQVDASLVAGADLHLAKPLTGDALFGAIDACLKLNASPLRASAAG